VPPTQTPPTEAPDQTLPEGEAEVEVDQEVEAEGKTPPGQDPGKVRGHSEDARGHNKPEPR
jgi:hypothetical protein